MQKVFYGREYYLYLTIVIVVVIVVVVVNYQTVSSGFQSCTKNTIANFKIRLPGPVEVQNSYNRT